MLGNAFTGWHLIAILVVILLLFGATRLPALSKSLGQSMRIFRNETRAMKEENAADKANDTVPPVAPTVTPSTAAPVTPVAETTTEHPKP
ncbi:Sec-independent protein translocase subunit TatA [Herbiconiux liangxiaofengii]|uniref:Sec-independent protein translocase subunit TatA n=1 Tax=Herbiconiux liangxiaofengii TaxID=3342795 RepID=UPI0035B96068